MKKLLKDVQTGEIHETHYEEGEDLYIKGTPAIVNGEITSYYEEVSSKDSNRIELEKYEPFFMYDVSDELFSVDEESLARLSRVELKYWVERNKLMKHVNLQRSRFNIIRQIMDLKAKAEKKNYIGVKDDG